MPFYLEPVEDMPELTNFKSILVVPCRFCPAANMAVKTNAPYFDFLRGFLKTPSYERYLKTMRSNLEKKGIKVDVVDSISPHNFVMCMWTDKQRRKLLEKADQYDVFVVLGCEAAVQTINDSVKSTSCRVFHGMTTRGLMSIKPELKFPCKIFLKLNSLTAVNFPEKSPEAAT